MKSLLGNIHLIEFKSFNCRSHNSERGALYLHFHEEVLQLLNIVLHQVLDVVKAEEEADFLDAIMIRLKLVPISLVKVAGYDLKECRSL